MALTLRSASNRPNYARHVALHVGIVAGALAGAGSLAHAAPTGPQRLEVSRALESAQSASRARARAKAGDCKGALDGFDDALRTTEDATLYRDRGLCHEKLGHVFPAIDDYRNYLTMRAEAPDADDIRDRLTKLEGFEKREREKGDDGTPLTVRASMNWNGERSDDGDERSPTPRRYEATLDEVQRTDAALASPVRLGRGLVIGPYFGLRRAFGSDASTDLGYMVGGSFRYSFGRVVTGLAEIGYAAFGKSGDNSAVGGLQTQLGLEFRARLDSLATNQLFFTGAFGYERLSQAAIKFVDVVYFLPRLKVGFRHVFGPSLGLELSVDGGPYLADRENLPLGAQANSQFRFMLGGTLALAVGF
jgi:hypothetical protein